MPNHVTTIIRADREVIHALLTEDGVDFNRIIPMPDNVIRGSIGHAKIDGVMQKVYWEDDNFSDPERQNKAKPYPEDAIDWYTWSIENWGTKWNAYSHEVSEDDTVVRFDTAWSHPWPIMEKLTEMFPREQIQVVYADEDLGHNLGVYMVKDQAFHDRYIKQGSDEAINLASIIKYGCTYADLDAESSPTTYLGVQEVFATALSKELKVLG